MKYTILILPLSAAAVVLGMLLGMEVGRRIGTRRLARNPEGLGEGIGSAEAAVFALVGLLIAFTFSGAWSRFEGRRALITQEANDIGTAYLRVDLLPAEAQPELRELFRRYVDVRAVTYRNVLDDSATAARLAEGAALQREIWAKAMAAARRPDAIGTAVPMMAPALNAMIDITTTTVMATRNHMPTLILFLMGGLSVVSALLFGYNTSRNKLRPWIHTLLYASVVAVAVYVVLDLEFPRVGLITVGDADQVFVELRQSMH